MSTQNLPPPSPRKSIVFRDVKQRDEVNNIFPWGTFNRFILRVMDELIELGKSSDGKATLVSVSNGSIRFRSVFEIKDIHKEIEDNEDKLPV